MKRNHKVTYIPASINNFHNSSPLTLIISCDMTDGYDGYLYRISKGQAKRIQKHFCGITDCRCAAGAAVQLNAEGTEWGVRVGYCH